MEDNVRKRSGRFQSLGEVAERLLRSRGLLTKAKEASVRAIWEHVVGEYIARNTEALWCSGGVLIVTTKEDASLAQAVSHLREDIRRKLNEALGAEIVREIHFQPRQPGKKPKGSPPLRREQLEFAGEEIPQTEVDDIQLSPEDEAEIDQLVSAIANAEIAASVRRALVKEKKLQLWKLEHGYRPCTRCGALHKDGSTLCLACQVVDKARHPRDKLT